jgi:putative transposase
LLRPDAVLNALFIYVVGVFAPRFGVQVHAAVCLSTHFHLVVTATEPNVSQLMHRVDMHLAKALQIMRKYVGGVVWAPGKLSIVELKTTQAVVEQIAYVIVNPVKAGLVYGAVDWPGVVTAADDLGRRVLRAVRPLFYFVGMSAGEPWPDDAEIRLYVPPCLAELPEDEARKLIQDEVDMQEREARAYAKAQGWKVMGRVAAMNVSPYRVATSWQDFGELNPHIAAGRGQKEARIAALEELMKFRQNHRDAKRRWVTGDRDVVFPAGTYWMRVHHGARVEPFT